ncbi:MAG: hypothetical protein M1131_03380 [Actinobacteria bacterium]|jgi:hypothetical protein|nr:hypothetical protein [Actinomycetota bacterium]MCL6095601.1 hypothetical protein [Actinomycetota bacterium]
MNTTYPPQADSTTTDRKLPPVTVVAVVTLAIIVVGGIYLASYVPRQPPLGVAIGLLAAAGVLFIGNVVALSKVHDFAWKRFFQVARWAILAYTAIASMLEYVFVFDHTRGMVLVVLSLMLLVFALDIPLIMSFTVARYVPDTEDDTKSNID